MDAAAVMGMQVRGSDLRAVLSTDDFRAFARRFGAA